LAIALSAKGVMVGSISTTVTSAPSRRHTLPSSSPTAPAPITTRRFGTELKSRDLAGCGDGPPAGEDGDLVLLHQHRHTVGQLFDDAALAGKHGLEIESYFR